MIYNDRIFWVLLIWFTFVESKSCIENIKTGLCDHIFKDKITNIVCGGMFTKCPRRCYMDERVNYVDFVDMGVFSDYKSDDIDEWVRV